MLVSLTMRAAGNRWLRGLLFAMFAE